MKSRNLLLPVPKSEDEANALGNPYVAVSRNPFLKWNEIRTEARPH